MRNLAVLEMPKSAGQEEAPETARRGRGEGRIFQIGRKKKQEVKGEIFWIQYYSRGRQIRESSHSDKKQVAQELLTRRLAEKLDGHTPVNDAKKLRYEDMRASLYAHYEIHKFKSLLRRVKDGKPEVYLGTVSGEALNEHFEGCVAADITYARLMAFVRNRQKAGKSTATINRSLQALKRMFSLAVKAKELPALTVPDFPRLKEPPARKDFFTKEQYEKVCAELPDYLKPVFVVAYHSGMRAEEILSRKWRHVDFEAGLIRLEEGETKNGEARVIPMIGPVAGLLQEMRAGNPKGEFIFTRNSERIHDFRRSWKSAMRRAGCKGHLFHGTRRGMATNLMEAGVDEQSAMEITGHKDPSIFRRYRQLRERNVQATGKKLEAFLSGSGQVSGQATQGVK